MLVHWIWLAVRPGLSDREKAALVDQFHDPEDIYSMDAESIAQLDHLSPEAREALTDRDLSLARKILRLCEDKRIHICTLHDAQYPSRLKNITDPPLVLYYKGRLPDLDSAPVISVVGTRKATAYGLGISKRMGYQIAQCGGIVVSGLAEGIDGMAMRGALTAGGSVIGVLGCGADVVYPSFHKSLYADTESCGCLLTEFPPGTPPLRWNFPKRNRIISGIACGVLVVEAPLKSGSLITARQAADQGRDVFVVPGNIDVDACAGSNALLRSGAISVSSGWDVVSEYAAIYPDKIRKSTEPGLQAGYPDEVVAAARREEPLPKVAQKPRSPRKNPAFDKSSKKKPIDNGGSGTYIDLDGDIPGLSAEEQQIVDQLRDGQMLVDELIHRLQLPAGQVLGTLTMLQIKGITVSLPGKRVALKGKQ